MAIAPSVSRPPVHWCLAVGIEGYPFLPPVPAAAADALALKAAWTRVPDLGDRHCILLSDRADPVDGQPTYPNRETLQTWLARVTGELVQRGDLLWVSLGGYGAGDRGRDYFLPVEANASRPTDAAIAFADIYRWLAQARDDRGASSVLLVLDLYRDGPADRVPPWPEGTEIEQLARAHQIPTLLASHGAAPSSPDSANGEPSPFGQAMAELLVEPPSHNLFGLHRFVTQRMGAALGTAPQLIVEPPPALYTTVLVHNCPELSNAPAPYILFPADGPPSGPAAPTPPPSAPPSNDRDRETTPPPDPSAPDDDSSTDPSAIDPSAIDPTTDDGIDIDNGRNRAGDPPNDAPPDAIAHGADASPEIANFPGPPPVTTTVTDRIVTARSSLLQTLTTMTQNSRSFTHSLADAKFARNVFLWGGFLIVLLLVGVFLRNRAELMNPPGRPASSAEPTSGAVPDLAPRELAALAQDNIESGKFADAVAVVDAIPPEARTPETLQIRKDALAYIDNDRLAKARIPIRISQASEFNQAIRQASQIPPTDPLYPQAQQDIDRWSRVIFDLAQGRARSGQFSQAIAAAKLIPTDRVALKDLAQRSITRWETQAKQQASNRQVLQQATSIVEPGSASSYSRAIALAAAVPAGQPEHFRARSLIETWSDAILRLAYGRASKQQYDSAIAAAKLIPANTAAHPASTQAIKIWQKRKGQ